MATEHKTIHAAMAAAYAEMPAVEPDASNDHFRSKYTTLGVIIAKVRPVLAANGLFAIQRAGVVYGEDGKPTGHVSATTTIFHKGGEFIDFGSCVVPAAKNDAHGYGSALTYAKRYGLAAALGITDVEDDDGNGSIEPKSGRREVVETHAGKKAFAAAVANATGHDGQNLTAACRAACLQLEIDPTTEDSDAWKRGIEAVRAGKVEFRAKETAVGGEG